MDTITPELPDGAPVVFTPDEARVIARRSRASLYADIAAGRLRAYRIGGVGPLRIWASDLALFLRGQRTPEDPPAIGVSPERS